MCLLYPSTRPPIRPYCPRRSQAPAEVSNVGPQRQQTARLFVCFVARPFVAGPATLAGGDAGQAHQVPPAERGARGGEFLRGGAVELFRVVVAVFARGESQEQVDDRFWVTT